MNIFKKLFCKHNYDLINQIELPSEFDIMMDRCGQAKSYHSVKRTYISDYKCSCCGKFKRLKAKTA